MQYLRFISPINSSVVVQKSFNSFYLHTTYHHFLFIEDLIKYGTLSWTFATFVKSVHKQKNNLELCVVKVFKLWVVGRGVNREGLISNLPWSKRVPLDPSWTNMPFEKNVEVGLQTPPLPQTHLYSLWKRQKLKIWILFLQWSKYIPINLKGTLKTFNGKFEGYYVPHSSQMWGNCHFWPKTAIWDSKYDHGVCRSHPIIVWML